MNKAALYCRLVAVAMASVALQACNNKPTPEEVSIVATPYEQPSTEANSGNLAGFKEAIRKEPKVVDFVYDPAAAVQWTIGVKDDGTPRYGYASYICGMLPDYGLDRSGVIVRIVDYAKFMAAGGNGRDASLGSVDCESERQMMP